MAGSDTRLTLRYVVPTVVFGLFTSLEGYAPTGLYPAVYALKIVAVVASLLVMRQALGDIRPTARVLPAAVLVGLVVCAQWVLLDRWLPYPHLGTRTAFDPFTAIPSDTWRTAFLALRFTGLVLVVPVMEELFLRSFVLRAVTDGDFTSVPIGTYSQAAFWAVAGLSALAHPEWLAAIVTSVCYTLLLRQTKSLFACVAAHAVTNAALGVYVLTTHAFQYW